MPFILGSKIQPSLRIWPETPPKPQTHPSPWKMSGHNFPSWEPRLDKEVEVPSSQFAPASPFRSSRRIAGVFLQSFVYCSWYIFGIRVNTYFSRKKSAYSPILHEARHQSSHQQGCAKRTTLAISGLLYSWFSSDQHGTKPAVQHNYTTIKVLNLSFSHPWSSNIGVRQTRDSCNLL